MRDSKKRTYHGVIVGDCLQAMGDAQHGGVGELVSHCLLDEVRVRVRVGVGVGVRMRVRVRVRVRVPVRVRVRGRVRVLD